jgi:hypothetical protein
MVSCSVSVDGKSWLRLREAKVEEGKLRLKREARDGYLVVDGWMKFGRGR